MMKGKTFMKRIILAAAAIAVLLTLGGCEKMIGRYVGIRGKHLNSYSYSSGGGMNGGYHRETVKKYQDQALITIESADWFAQDPTVAEYLTDTAVLEELEAVVRKYRMNFWNGKEFSKMFVCDGESESYCFYFDDDDVYFSSQIYPMRYRKKLADLDNVVRKYIDTAEKLPGLVGTRTDEEENFLLPEGKLDIYVYSYAENVLGVKILNGTDEPVELPGSYQLIFTDTDTVVFEENDENVREVSGQSRDEIDIRLKERLQAGHYKIVFGDMEIPFEIR